MGRRFGIIKIQVHVINNKHTQKCIVVLGISSVFMIYLPQKQQQNSLLLLISLYRYKYKSQAYRTYFDKYSIK